MPVPFADLRAQYASIKDEIDEAMAAVIAESSFVRGRFVEQFEADYARATDTAECVSCANGTDALWLAMHALDVKPGDEVITTAHSWISTSAMITRAGAIPIFVDTHPDTFTINPALIEDKITSRTVGVIPVHLFGQPADMDEIMAIADRNSLWVIEDCAQAHMATYRGRQVGTFGAAATWSFYPGKNLGAMGDAGAATTNDPELARRMARFARHGGLKKGEHEIEGINSRLDGLQAAILSVKLRHLPRWTAHRQRAADMYDELLGRHQAVRPPTRDEGRTHVFHLYVIQHVARDALAKHLAERGIQTAINYPVALPFLDAYSRFSHRSEEFPAAHANQSRIVSLPMSDQITDDQLNEVVTAIEQFGQS